MTAKGGSFASPADQAVAVTPSDSTVLTETRALYVGGLGDLLVTMGGPDATDVTFQSVPAGMLLPIMVTKVKAATTATKIIALF